MKCGDRVIYRGGCGMIVGKTYGHVVNPNIGIRYDVKLDGQVYGGICQNELMEPPPPDEEPAASIYLVK